MKEKPAHNTKLLSFVPILAMLGQLEDVIGNLTGLTIRLRYWHCLYN